MSEDLDRLRAIAAQTPSAPAEMRAYLDNVRTRAYAITDADVEALRASGLSEDEIFEQTVVVAIAEGLRRIDAAAAAIG